MLLVFTKEITPRLEYIFDFCFNEYLGIKYSLCTNEEEFQNHTEAKLNYSHKDFNHTIQIKPHPILFESKVENHNWDWVKLAQNDFKLLENEEFSADPFAISFYFLSRMEERVNKQRDKHERFTGKLSIAFQYGFSHKPIVEFMFNELGSLIQNKFPNISARTQAYAFHPSFDIDSTYAFIKQGIVRTKLLFIRDFFKNQKLFWERILCVFRLKKDPYDTYELIEKTCKKYNTKPDVFFLTGPHSKFNKNIPFRKLKKLITRIQSFANVGVHPSYESSVFLKVLRKEIIRIQAFLGRESIPSRQHFLRFQAPDTFEKLEYLGIRDDFSMGYTDIPGFRAGISKSFPFFCLRRNQKTKLRLHPLFVMDGVLKDQLKQSPEEAMQYMKEHITRLKLQNSEFRMIWHNHSISDYGEWKGWQKVFLFMMEEGK